MALVAISYPYILSSCNFDKEEAMEYNQYIIYYKKDRGLMGGAAVGQQVISQTTHVSVSYTHLDVYKRQLLGVGKTLLIYPG